LSIGTQGFGRRTCFLELLAEAALFMHAQLCLRVAFFWAGARLDLGILCHLQLNNMRAHHELRSKPMLPLLLPLLLLLVFRWFVQAGSTLRCRSTEPSLQGKER